MKSKNIITPLLLLSIVFLSCSELEFGDNFLAKQPSDNGANIDSMFASRIASEKVLTKVYTYLPYGLFTSGDRANNKLGDAILENITDLCQSCLESRNEGPKNLYYTGALSASLSDVLQGSEAYRYGDESDWDAIRYAWIYIENAHKIPDMSAEEKNERIAEAKTIIALCYSDMVRNVGGVTWLDHAVDVNETMKFTRLTFEQSIDHIVSLLDEAIPYLRWKWDVVNDGRMTKAGAMGLKMRMLLFAASPTFNSNNLWHPYADKNTCYGNEDINRWKKAMKAGEEFMTALSLNRAYALTQPTDDTPMAKRKAYRSAYYDRGGSEVLISTRKGYNDKIHATYLSQRHYYGPTLNYVNMFSWSDGTDFPENFDWEKPIKQPFFENGVPTRDPRLYENVAVPGDNYFDGTSAPIYVNSPNFIKGTGFLIMKFVLPNTEDRVGRPTQWPYLRLPEVLLSYAEAINEYYGAPNKTAYECINTVRARVGLSPLKDLNKEEFREALLKERALELGFEEVRWYDLIRWGREKDFRKQLYGLTSKGDDRNNPTKFEFSVVKLKTRFWTDNWDTKWYLAPIPISEVNKNYGITQNPGW